MVPDLHRKSALKKMQLREVFLERGAADEVALGVDGGRAERLQLLAFFRVRRTRLLRVDTMIRQTLNV
jgi:hypothetical protein